MNTIIENKSIPTKQEFLSGIEGLSEDDCNLYSFLSDKIKNAASLFKRANDDESLDYNSFSLELWTIINQIHSRTLNINPKNLNKFQLFFRGELHSFFTESLVFSRALTKPYGYPGDYVMLQTLYNNKTTSKTKLGRFLDQFFFDDDLAKAVVNRVEAMGDRVINFINDSKNNEINILNIASGSGFELKKIIEKTYNKKVIYHCFDQEVASLLYIKQNCVGKNKNVEIKLYREDIKAFFRNWGDKKKFDLIYNIGLADYLPDIVLLSLIKESLVNLNVGGAFVIAHKDYLKFPYHHPSWFYDWNFIHRSLNDYQLLIQSKIQDNFSIWFESPKEVIYFSEFKNEVGFV